jgi:hypothetical protein
VQTLSCTRITSDFYKLWQALLHLQVPLELDQGLLIGYHTWSTINVLKHAIITLFRITMIHTVIHAITHAIIHHVITPFCITIILTVTHSVTPAVIHDTFHTVITLTT